MVDALFLILAVLASCGLTLGIIKLLLRFADHQMEHEQHLVSP